MPLPTSPAIASKLEALNEEDRLTVLLILAAALEYSGEFKLLATLEMAAERCVESRERRLPESGDDEI